MIIKPYTLFIALFTTITLCCYSAKGLDSKVSIADIDFNFPQPPIEKEKRYFVIAKNGEFKAVLVKPARSHGRTDIAVGLMEHYLSKMVGKPIRVYKDNQRIPRGKNQIHIGATEAFKDYDLALPAVRYGKMEYKNISGYLVKTVSKKQMFIRGLNHYANLHGTVGFLKRYLGVHCFWEGQEDIGEVVPKSKNVSIPNLEWRDWPYFLSRFQSGLALGGKWRRIIPFMRNNETIPVSENYGLLLDPNEYWESNPEYFPLIDGKRVTVDPSTWLEDRPNFHSGWQPCLSNPEVADIMANGLIDIFKKNPGKVAEALSLNDGGGDCMCSKCKDMDSPNTNYSTLEGMADRYVKFSNHVAEIIQKEYPNRILGFLSYGATFYPPKSTKLHPMLMPSPSVQTHFFNKVDSWLVSKPSHIGLYMYHNSQTYFIMPRMDLLQTGKRIRYIVSKNIGRQWYQEMYTLWPIDGIVAIAQNEMLWDPRKKAEDILDEYCDLFFGKASGKMKRFYLLLSEAYQDLIEKTGAPHPYAKDRGNLTNDNRFIQFTALPWPVAQKCLKLLDKASSKVKRKELEKQRVHIVKAIFKFIAIGSHIYDLQEKIGNVKTFDKAQITRMVAWSEAIDHLYKEWYATKTNIIEKKPISNYACFGRKNGKNTNTFYEAIQEGKIHNSVLVKVTNAFKKAGKNIGTKLGTKKAKMVFGPLLNTSKTSWINHNIKIAALNSLNIKNRRNLLKDGGFEKRAKKIMEFSKYNAYDHLDAEHLRQVGRLGISYENIPGAKIVPSNDAHSGKYAISIDSHRQAIIWESIYSPKKGYYRFAAWFKNIKGKEEGKANYHVQILMRKLNSKDKITKNYFLKLKTNEWTEFECDLNIPEGIKSISLNIRTSRQPKGEKLLIDDLYISRYRNI